MKQEKFVRPVRGQRRVELQGLVLPGWEGQYMIRPLADVPDWLTSQQDGKKVPVKIFPYREFGKSPPPLKEGSTVDIVLLEEDVVLSKTQRPRFAFGRVQPKKKGFLGKLVSFLKC